MRKFKVGQKAKGFNSRQMIESVSDDLARLLKSIETDDYQNRGGDYPESGEPDTIYVSGNFVNFSFKNTPESVVKSWVERFLKSKGFLFDHVSTSQTGAYEDDWVDCSVRITGHKSLDESVCSLNEKLYSMDDVQDMLTACRKDADLKKKILSDIKDSRDRRAIKSVIDSGWYETFLRYDSAVMDKFINSYVRCAKKKGSLKESCEYQNGSYKVYFNNRQENVRTDAKGAGTGDYEVWNGDNFIQSFDDYNDAVEFIDSELEESHVKSVTDMILEGVSVREALQGHHSRGAEDELKVLGVTLLTEFNYQRAKEDIPKADFVWWLKNTTIKGDKSLYVDTDGSVGKCDPTVTNAVRPVLRIAVFSNTGRITVGTKFKFAGEIFTVLSVDYAICDGFIGACQFDDGVHSVDVPFEETKLYKYINSWFNKNKNSAIELL